MGLTETGMTIRTHWKTWIVGLCVLLIAPICQAQIYKWVDENGTTHFSDSKPESGNAETLDIAPVNSIDSVSYDWVKKPEAASVGRVTMYATSTCGYCKKARRYFGENGIPYTEYDIDKNRDARKRWQRLGGRGVPLILVGNRKMHGFSESGFDRIYP